MREKKQEEANKFPPGSIAADLRLLGLGVAVLVTGTFVYILARPVGVYLIPDLMNLHHLMPLDTGVIGGSLPAFTHVLAFSLITACLSSAGKSGAAAVCAGWAIVNTGFEIGQHPDFEASIAGASPAWFEHVWLLERIDNYFLNGTFDFGDVAAIWLAALTAFFVIILTRAGRDSK